MNTIQTEHPESFKLYLTDEEKSASTVEKYLRDISSFLAWNYGDSVGKETLLEYKKYLTGCYAPTGVNSMLSSLNSFFAFHGWHELKVKSIRIQRQIFASKDRELTKAE